MSCIDSEGCNHCCCGWCVGGQKHRVALARACYASADVYLMDDPLSAVDAHVGRHLVDECLTKLLQGRTRILVTHQLQFLPEADMIVMMEDGSIARSGTHAELLTQGVVFAEFALASQVGDEERHVSADAAHPQVDGAEGARISANGRTSSSGAAGVRASQEPEERARQR